MESTPITTEALLAHSDWVRRLVSGLVFDPSRTEDVLQETWLVALARPPKEDLDLRAWLATVARSVVKNLGRGESRRKRREAAVARVEALSDTVDVIAKARLQGRMVEAVLALDEPYRTCVLLRYFEELPPREIAERLGRPVNTVRTQVARGLERLRSELDAEYGDRNSWGMAFLPLLAQVRGSQVAVVQGSLVLKTGGLIMLWKWMLPVAATALALFMWSENEDADRGGPEEIARRAEPAQLVAPDRGTETQAVAEIAMPNREALAEAEVDEVAAPKPGPLYLTEGRAVDATGQPLQSFELRFEDPSPPQLQGTRLLVRGEYVELTPEMKALVEERTEAAGERFRELLDEMKPDDVTVLTDSAGRFSIELPFPNAEPIPVALSYCCLGNGIHRSATLTPERVFVFATTEPLSGKVMSESGDPLYRASLATVLDVGRLTNFPLALEDTSTRSHWSTMTDKNGAFSFDAFPVLPGASIEVHRGGYDSKSVAYSSRTRGYLEITLQADDIRYRVTGTVLSELGAIVPNATLTLGQYSALSDTRGRFEIAAEYLSGDEDLIAMREGVVPSVIDDIAELVKLDAAKGRDLVLRLGPPAQSISGRVIDSRGMPQKRARLFLRGARQFGSTSDDVEERVSGQERSARTTDSKGRFEISGLFGESYDLIACDMKKYLAGRVDGVAPGTTDLVIVIDRDSRIRELTGQVVDRRGRGVSEAQLGITLKTAIFPESGTSSSQTLERGRADGDGRFSLKNVPTEEVKFQISGTGIETTAVDLSNWNGGELKVVVPLELRFQFEPDATEGADSFRVFDDHGEGLRLVSITSGVTSHYSRHSRYYIKDREALPTFRVIDSATDLVFYSNGNEVRRITLDLKRGEIARLR